MKYKEMEFKYNAKDINLTTFKEFCTLKNPVLTVVASGYDHFYQKQGDQLSFCRLRSSHDSHQLTFKKKTTDSNNFVRTEHNIDLDIRTTSDQIEALCAEFGYHFNSSIFKNCFVFKYDWYTLVYYICYDTDLKELGRFVEIEIAEDHPWESQEDAWGKLLVLEKLCKELGISSQGRIKRSLYELFAQDST